MLTDPIADFLTQIRNASQARKPNVAIKASCVKKRITELLHEQGYIEKYNFDDNKGHQGTIAITLKYNPKTKQPAIKEIVRVSKPSRREYASSKDLPHVYNGLGIGIVSTSQGIMTYKAARKEGIGGEKICYIY